MAAVHVQKSWFIFKARAALLLLDSWISVNINLAVLSSGATFQRVHDEVMKDLTPRAQGTRVCPLRP